MGTWPQGLQLCSRQSVERRGNTQLTLDDAIHYDHGMRMGQLTFDHRGRRLMRGNPRRTRGDAPSQLASAKRNRDPVQGELTEMMRQIGDWPPQLAMERTIPQIRFTTNIEPIKIPVGLRNFVAREAVTLKAELDAGDITYVYWYQSRMVNRAMAERSRKLSLPLKAVATSLDIRRNPEVIASEFNLTDNQFAKLLESIAEMTVGEVLSLALITIHIPVTN